MGKKEKKNEWITEYEEECRRQSDPYEQWMKKWESGQDSRKQGTTDAEQFAVVPVKKVFSSWEGLAEALTKMLQQLKDKVQYVIFTGEEGQVAEQAFDWLAEYCTTHPEEEVLYGDEDVWNQETKKREHPWFKPDWSPDTLHSFLYVGNVVVMKTSILKRLQDTMSEEAVWQQCRQKYRDYEVVSLAKEAVFWGCLLYLADAWGLQFGHLDRILYHKYAAGKQPSDSAPELQRESGSAAVVHVRYPFSGRMPLVSVVIPSKDHPKLLKQCLLAIKKETEYPSYEIIVVDNGSSLEHQAEIRVLQEELHFQYLYEKMDFNFSAMCNLGAAHAKGELLLFLNDDIEVCGREWMTILAEQAVQPHTGAVGAKLYYPDSDLIQHAGITNMKIGPAHKLGGMHDQGVLYHGRNLADTDVLAVTAACLMVERKKYDMVNGFAGELAVAYNDVDFCFSLYEKGFYNILRSDVVLYHHESLSRGSDEDREKAKRLIEERIRLYQRHPALYGRDPFYSRHLVQERLDTDYHVEYTYEYEQNDRYSKRTILEGKKHATGNRMRRILRKGPWIQYHLDEVQVRQADLLEETSLLLEIKGWCALTDLDMAEYQRGFLLVGQDGKIFQYEMLAQLRPDAAAILTKQPHGALCGFVVRIRCEEIEAGDYQVGFRFLHKDGGKEIIQYGEILQVRNQKVQLIL